MGRLFSPYVVILACGVITFQLPTAVGDCVGMAQALNNGGSQCKRNGGWGSGSYNEPAPTVMSYDCWTLKGVLDANRPPSSWCCMDLIRFIAAGCTCDNNLRSMAMQFAGVDYETFYAIGRVAQIQCGYGKVWDPCTGNFGTCEGW
eukprot:jgi/Botrbrau1/19464/Bobra.0338s0084.1